MAFEGAMKMMGGRAKPKVGGMMKGEEKPAEKAETEGAEGDAMTMYSHGDGTYHTERGGEQMEHPTLGHALIHMAHHNEPESKHMHISHDGLSVKSHGISESGEHDGPHEHDGTDGAKEHMDSLFGGEGDEDQDDGEESEMPNGLRGLNISR